MNLSDIKELIKLIEETDVTELTLENDGTKIVIRKSSASRESGQVEEVEIKPEKTTAKEVKLEKKDDEKLDYFTAQMVGTFYSSPKPNADSFVVVGDNVSKGDRICIIEAMKLFNEIKADFDGVIREVLVEDGEMVEYGQKLFAVEKIK